MVALLASVAWAHGAVARAEGCPAVTEQVRQAQAAHRSLLAGALPDCRAYEQVSPVEKRGVDVKGEPGLVQAAPDGHGITFWTAEPLPGTVGSYAPASYLSVRSPAATGWSTHGLEPLVPPSNSEDVVGLSTDLTRAIDSVGGEQAARPCLAPAVEVCAGFLEGNDYIEDATGAFQLFASLGSPAPALRFVDATPGGSRVLFVTRAKLASQATSGVPNLYEWDEAQPPAERISLVGVLPTGAAPEQGSLGGPGGPAVQGEGIELPFYTQHTISEDGTKAFFSDIKTGIVYMRELGPNKTIQISAGEKAFWRDSTSNGEYVFYTEEGKSHEGEELYRFNVRRFTESLKPEPEALAEAREPITEGVNEGAKGVLGVLGISEADGSYAYFVARGELASNQNANGETPVPGAPNLYEWHEGAFTFIGRPEAEEDWYPRSQPQAKPGTSSAGEKASRVSPDGRALLFSSAGKQSPYNNNGLFEFYLFDAGQPLSSTNPHCVTCNPNGVPATASASLERFNPAVGLTPPERNAFVTHNLSNDGHRVFFETEEALAPGDANLQNDIYEWEAAGSGSCQSTAQNGGCLYLISTGQSTQRSYFGDASANGSDVSFFTGESLVSQDQDENFDLYDARADGGILDQNPLAPPAPCAQEGTCREMSSNTASMFGAPSSTSFSGSGNLPAVPPTGTVAPRGRTAAQIRAHKLAKALTACRRFRSRSRRASCRRRARNSFVAPKARRAGHHRRAGR